MPRKLSPKKTAKKQTHFDRMAKQEKQAKQIKELKQEVKNVTSELEAMNSNYNTMKGAYDEIKVQHNHLAQSSEKLLQKDKELEEKNKLLLSEIDVLKTKEMHASNDAKNFMTRVEELTKLNENANDTITKLANEKTEMHTKITAQAQKILELEGRVSVPVEAEVKEVPTDAGNSSGAV